MSGNKEKQCNWHNGVVQYIKTSRSKDWIYQRNNCKYLMICEGMKVGGKRGFIGKEMVDAFRRIYGRQICL